MDQVSAIFKSLMKTHGFPPHIYLVGISLPGGTTDPANNYAAFSILAPSRTTHLSPIRTSFPIVQE